MWCSAAAVLPPTEPGCPLQDWQIAKNPPNPAPDEDGCRCALVRHINSTCVHNRAVVPCRKVPSHMTLFFKA